MTQLKNMKKTLFLLVVCITMLTSFVIVDRPANTGITVHADQTVYITRTGSKYHTHACGRGNYFPTSLSNAKSMGLDACAKCFPGGAPSSKSSISNSAKSAVKSATTKKKMKLNMTSKVLLVGQSCKIKAKHASGSVSFKSSNTKVAKVTSSGKVTAKKKGKATITVKSGGQKKKCKIIVEQPYLSKTELTLEVGEAADLKLYGCSHDDEWESDDESIADFNGETVIATGVGTTTVIVWAHNREFMCRVNVVAKQENQEKIDNGGM